MDNLKVEYMKCSSTQNDSGFDLWRFLTVRVWRCGSGWESSYKVSSLENCDLGWLGRCRWCHGLCLIMVTHSDLCHAANTHHSTHGWYRGDISVTRLWLGSSGASSMQKLYSYPNFLNNTRSSYELISIHFHWRIKTPLHITTQLQCSVVVGCWLLSVSDVDKNNLPVAINNTDQKHVSKPDSHSFGYEEQLTFRFLSIYFLNLSQRLLRMSCLITRTWWRPLTTASWSRPSRRGCWTRRAESILSGRGSRSISFLKLCLLRDGLDVRLTHYIVKPGPQTLSPKTPYAKPQPSPNCQNQNQRTLGWH